MAFCNKWQFTLSVLMFVDSIFSFFYAGYFYRMGNFVLVLMLLAIGNLFFVCGMVASFIYFLTYKPPVGNPDSSKRSNNSSKSVRFSSLLQVYDDIDLDAEEDSNHEEEAVEEDRNTRCGNFHDCQENTAVKFTEGSGSEADSMNDSQEAAASEGLVQTDRASELVSCLDEIPLTSTDPDPKLVSAIKHFGNDQRDKAEFHGLPEYCERMGDIYKNVGFLGSRSEENTGFSDVSDDSFQETIL